MLTAMPSPTRLEPRGDRPVPLSFKQGAHPPYAIRWYGATSLWGHFRNLVSTAIARESVDSRDWMRPLEAHEMLAGITKALGLENKGTLLDSLERPLWLDWVADTGDDRDVSQAVARMIFAEYQVDEADGPLTLPRGDVLLFGGDTAYPVATTEEIHRRLLMPWNEVLRELHDPLDRRPRVLLGIPGNHDWYDGLDGFGRFFRRRAPQFGPQASAHDERDERDGRDGLDAPDAPDAPDATPALRHGRQVGRIAHGLHLDEVRGILDMIRGAAKAIQALWRGTNLAHRRHLTLSGYEPVQESTFWAIPLAPGLDLWGVDRQLSRLDYRQRGYFHARRREVGKQAAVWLVAPDPAIAFGEGWEVGEQILNACDLSLERDRVLYQCGDMHQYERRVIGDSMHVIAGGGGAFLHGTRIVPDPKPAAAAYPNAKITRRLALQVPLKLMIGRAGYLVHMAAALVAGTELAIGWHHRTRFLWVSVAMSAMIAGLLYTIAGHRRAQPRRVLALAIPFGVLLGSLPFWLTMLLRQVAHSIPLLGRDVVSTVAYAFAASFLFGVFLTLCALGGLEMQQVFTVLGHPGFKHFVRMRVDPSGVIDAWAIGKDDPLSDAGPWTIDRWTFSARSREEGSPSELPEGPSAKRAPASE